jgi:glutathionylspermidine synthase
MDVHPDVDQFNSLHERLVASWRDLASSLRGTRVHFAAGEDLEDQMTIGYLRDTALQAGLETTGLGLEDIGWNTARGAFVDLEQRPIQNLFKLYPWEALLADPWGGHVPVTDIRWIEPAWKMLLSSKGILPILWQLFPGHPNLLPARRSATNDPFAEGWVRKPFHGREGANVTVCTADNVVTTTGIYGADSFVEQAYVDLGDYDGQRPVLGSWLVAGEPAGLGIRETTGYVTDNTACFVPHIIADIS